jgi:murein DD-endopeptidase MepM/ murein hydrolase activator NlpD
MSSTPAKSHEHIVKSGETLDAIARQNNVSREALLAANPEIQDPNLIRVDQVIVIPSQTEATPDSDQGTSDHGTPDGGTEEPKQSDAGTNAILFEAESLGASDKTARQDKLPQRGIHGVKASEAMAQFDRRRVMEHKAKFEQAARQFKAPPALLAAIASRESRGGGQLDERGFGDGGHGFGFMQVDNRSHSVVQDGGPAGQPHINQATQILTGKLQEVRQEFPELSDVEKMQTAVSRYNGGSRLPHPNSDRGTTGGDYMNDVWARARFYATVEEWNV